MADIIDAANDLTDLITQNAIDNRAAPLTFTGKCLNCGEDINSGNYCDKDCREDYEKIKRAQQLREGKV